MTITADVRPHTSEAAHEPPDDARPRWVRPALVVLLLATAALYLWALGSAGWANDYYAAAVQAGTQDWKAWLFGSLDAGNAITVDKPPAALWVMALSGRIFGFSAFTMLLPQALMGVSAVAVLYATVRRTSGSAAGLIAGVVLALTPVAALMFRFNNPDALLVLLMVVAAYCVMRATETASTRWIALAGCAMGFAFLTKMLQAFLVVPGFALVFLVAAPVGVWKRIGKLAVGAVAMIVSAGWYIALVSLWPAGSRPFIGGSSDNSLLQLALGYNGIDRVVGGRRTSGRRAGRWSRRRAQSLLRRCTGHRPTVRSFDGHRGVLAAARCADRTAGRTVVHQAHCADSAACGPGCCCGAGGCWEPLPCSASWTARFTRTTRSRSRRPSRLWLESRCKSSGGQGNSRRRGSCWRPCPPSPESGRSSCWSAHRIGGPRCGGSCWPDRSSPQRCSWWAPTGSAAPLPYWLPAQCLFGVAASAAYTVETVANHHGGPMVTAGPSRGDAPDWPGGRGPRGAAADNPTLEHLVEGADQRWAAATIGSMTASSLELKTGASVMAIGGFTGSDSSPTLAQFQGYVADHEVRYFIAGGREGPMRRGSANAQDIEAWVKQNFRPIDVAGTTVYDLDAATGN